MRVSKSGIRRAARRAATGGHSAIYCCFFSFRVSLSRPPSGLAPKVAGDHKLTRGPDAATRSSLPGNGDTMTAYDTFADAANTNALKVVLQAGESNSASGERVATAAAVS